MRITGDYHTHTVYSHGQDTIEQNVLAAIRKGLDTIVISDHGPSHILYGVRKSRLNRYLDEIDRMRSKYAGRIAVLTGIELNLLGLSGETDRLYDAAGRFDIRILGYHKLVAYADTRSFYNYVLIHHLYHRKWKAHLTQKITESYIHAVQSADIDIIAHPGYGVAVNLEKLAAACVKTGTCIEINSAHTETSPKDYEAISDTGVKFVVSSDAHRKEDVGNFGNALKLIAKAGIHKAQILNAV